MNLKSHLRIDDKVIVCYNDRLYYAKVVQKYNKRPNYVGVRLFFCLGSTKCQHERHIKNESKVDISVLKIKPLSVLNG